MRLRSITVAAVLTAALFGGFATPAGAAVARTAPEPTAVSVDDDSPKTLLETTPDGGALYGEGSVPSGHMMHPRGKLDCGYVTCSYYFSRSQTHKAHRNVALMGGGLTGLAASCGFISMMSGPASTVVGIICGASIMIYGQFFINALNHADADNKCLRIRWMVTGGGYSFYSDGGKFCKD